MTKWLLVGPVVGIALITAALVVGYVLVPPIIVQQVTENVQLIKGSPQYDRWVELPQALDFKVYIFNVTNVDEIQRGMQPKVEEIGPYVYSQHRKKYNIRFSRDRERVSYYQQLSFHFNKEKSGTLTEDDPITVLSMHMNSILQVMDRDSRRMVQNVTRGVERTMDRIPVINTIKKILDRYTPLQSILQAVEADTPTFLPIVNTQINEIFGPTRSFFINTTPRKFLFEGVEFCKNPAGLAQVVCSQVEERKSMSIVKSDDGNSLRFSMFAHKNKTHDGLYEINTGIRRLDRNMKIERWKGSRTLKFWKSDSHGAPTTCQFINGTDGTSAPPFRESPDDFYIFSSDICRSVHLQWEQKTSYNGINGYRYSITDDFLNRLDDCFCINKIKDALTDEKGCLYPGALDLSDCVDAPIVGTMPHFYNADERYNLLVDGLNPTRENHSIFMDLEPTTGSPLRGGKKMQFNMFLKRINQITLTDNFRTPRLFPVLWIDEGLELNDEMTGLIKRDLVNVILIVNIVQWTCVGIGAALIVGMTAWFIVKRRRSGVPKTISVDPIITEVKA